MRLRRWSLLFSFALVLLYLYFAFLYPYQKVADHAFFGGRNPVAIAHRGGMGLWPENTLFAFERSRALGVDVLDMDLRDTADGHIVVMHDETVDRTTDGHGPVKDMMLSELQKLDAGFRFQDGNGKFSYRGIGLRVPALEQVLGAFSDSRLNLEMKQLTPQGVVTLCHLIRQFGMEQRVLVVSFAHEHMVAFRKECPRVATSATGHEVFTFYQLNRFHLGSLYQASATSFQVPEYYRKHRVVEPGFLELMKAYNLRVFVWTVNEDADMRRLVAMGVNGILTDYPDRLMKQLGQGY